MVHYNSSILSNEYSLGSQRDVSHPTSCYFSFHWCPNLSKQFLLRFRHDLLLSRSAKRYHLLHVWLRRGQVARHFDVFDFFPLPHGGDAHSYFPSARQTLGLLLLNQ